MSIITLQEALILIIGGGSIMTLSYWLGTKDGFDKGWDRCMTVVGKKELEK